MTFQLKWIRSKIDGSDNQSKPYRAFEALFHPNMSFVLTWVGEPTDTYRNKVGHTRGIKQLIIAAIEKETTSDDWVKKTRGDSLIPNATVRFPTAKKWIQ